MTVNEANKRLLILTSLKEGLLRNQCAYVLATTQWETNHTFEPVREAYYVKNAEAWRKKNLRYYPWYARGFIGLTWEYNYKKAGDKIGVNLIANPDLAMEPNNAAKIAVIGMKEGWFTGKKLSDYITLKTSNFTEARRIINGTDKADEIAELAKKYDAELKASGYGSTERQQTMDGGGNEGLTVENYETEISPSPKPNFLSTLINFIISIFTRKR